MLDEKTEAQKKQSTEPKASQLEMEEWELKHSLLASEPYSDKNKTSSSLMCALPSD